MPKFLRLKLANPELIYSRAYWKCQVVLLKEEIYLKKCKINYLLRIQTNFYEELRGLFPEGVMKRIDFIIDEVQLKEQETKYRRHYRKFNNLLNAIYIQQQRRENFRKFLNEHPMNQIIKNIDDNDNAHNNPDNDESTVNDANANGGNNSNDNDNNDESEPKLVWNLSDRELTEEEVYVLEKGLSSNRRGTINHFEIISNVEYLFYQSSSVRKEQTSFQKLDEDPDDLKAATEKFFNEAQQSFNRNRNTTLDDKHEEQLLRNLSKDPSIVTTRPDKGKGVVVIYRADYIEKLERILSDTSKFRLVEKDPTGCREAALTSLLRRMKNEEYLTEQEYRFVKPVGSIPARLYGLPKVHKVNTPLRPIVSCVQSYNYRLGKFLADIIKPLRDSKYSFKNNDGFLKFLKQNSSLSTNKMISFDIESLFTNIPVGRTIDIICYKLYCTDPKLRLYIPEHYFRQMLEYATKWTHFLFSGKYYDQCDGVSMGTPLAAVFAETFMTDFEQKHLPGILDGRAPKLLAWCRYVDDTFTIVRPDEDGDQVRDLLNIFDPCIRFTVTPEVNDTIAFLDVMVKRNNKGFNTIVYRKETATKLMLKWNSLIPTAYKKSSIYPLVNSYSKFNGYPSNFVQSIINKQLNKYYQTKTKENLIPTTSTEIKYRYIRIPYVGKLSYVYSKKLLSIIKRYDPIAQVRTTYNTTNQTRRHFPTKDQLKPNQKSGVVYQVSCSNCIKTYIGKTIRQSYRRVNEHEKDVVKALIFIHQASSIIRKRKTIKQHLNTIKGQLISHNPKILPLSNPPQNENLLHHHNTFR
ncbi:unnamed protein product [Adineta ricciae]|uniref:Reverse transcriptase domain-containing protein n=1 Tax=Adineta ricciae TaxID=249248 RepID=A0A814YGJ5_ADIRI|nr:unnamed protein product [Adineta ricciae]